MYICLIIVNCKLQIKLKSNRYEDIWYKLVNFGYFIYSESIKSRPKGERRHGSTLTCDLNCSTQCYSDHSSASNCSRPSKSSVFPIPTRWTDWRGFWYDDCHFSYILSSVAVWRRSHCDPCKHYPYSHKLDLQVSPTLSQRDVSHADPLWVVACCTIWRILRSVKLFILKETRRYTHVWKTGIDDIIGPTFGLMQEAPI